MRKSYISAGCAVLLALCTTPLVSEAYFTTNQTATKITKSAAIYTIEYAFGLDGYDIYMPIIAERNLAHESTEKKVGYTFIENGDKIKEEGVSSALVLSAAPIVNGMYYIPKRTAMKMMLVAFLNVDESVTEEDFALHVQKLPYFVDKGGKTLEALQLNPSELQYYVTEEVELNTREN